MNALGNRSNVTARDCLLYKHRQPLQRFGTIGVPQQIGSGVWTAALAAYGSKQANATRHASIDASLLLAARRALLLALARDNLPQHHDTVPVHEGDARKALAILEGVTDERLLRLEAALRHLVGLQRVG